MTADETTAPRTRLPWKKRWIPYLIPWALRLIVGSARNRWLNTHYVTQARQHSPRVIFAFWHESMLQLVWEYRHRNAMGMISQHGDGEIIARAAHRLGYRTARGSTTRGGAAALWAMVREARRADGDLGITPDGPRGPRREIQMGIVRLSAATGMPIVPIGIGYASCWRAGSWDRMALPRPWTRCVTVFGEPLIIDPQHRSEEDLQKARDVLEVRLQELADHAEEDVNQLFAQGVKKLQSFDPFPPPPPPVHEDSGPADSTAT